ncbi:BSD-domain-containing protein [Hortaea werneckii]|nr:BSD-domain-containing protein [Hortaea werneckii]
MASPTSQWVRILDEVDDATALAIIETHLEALEASFDTGDADVLLAREMFSVELKRYRGTRPYEPASEPTQGQVAKDVGVQAAEQEGSTVPAQKRFEWPLGRDATKRRLMEFWRWLTDWYAHTSTQAGQQFSRVRPLKRPASPLAEESNKRQKSLEHEEAKTQLNVAPLAEETNKCQKSVEHEEAGTEPNVAPLAEEINKRQKSVEHEEAETQPNVAAPRIKCIACHDEAEDEDSKNFCHVPCGHWYCDDCLKTLFRVTITDESLFPPACCKQAFEFIAIRPHLPEELAAQFEAKKEELGNKNRIYCARPTCSAFIGMDHRNDRVAVCPDCKYETCLACKGLMHEDECPVDEALESVLKIAGDEDWQRCPDCKGMIELTFGCNHMTCPCSAEFCYVCTEPQKNCDCAQWVEERLYDRAQTVAGRGFAGGDVEVAAQRLRNNITCAHERAYNSANWTRFNFAADCEECRERMPYYIFECRLSYDHVQEESYSPANANDQSQKQANTSETAQTLNTEFQQAFQAVSASPWGSKLGGWFNQARKQGEAYLTDLQKEAQDAQGQAAQGWSKLQEEVTNRTRGLSLNAEPAPASGVPGEEAVPSIKTTEPEKEKQPAEHPDKPESLPADIVKEAGSLVASLRTTAAAKLKDLQRAEDAADEAFLKFGSNVRDFLRDAVVITAPTDADSSKPKGTNAAGNEVLFETTESGTGKKVFHTTRLDAQLHAIHTTASSFTQDPSQGAEWDDWTKNFDIDKQTDAIAQDLEKYEELRRAMEKLVPEKVEYKLFWTRYYFLRKAVEADERRRKEVLKGAAAQPEEEEVGWGSDNEDESATPSAKSAKPTNDSSTTLNATAGSSSNDLLKPKEPRRSTDDKSVADSDASYDIVSGATSRAAGSPKEEKKEKSEESDDDWE